MKTAIGNPKLEAGQNKQIQPLELGCGRKHRKRSWFQALQKTL